MPKCNSLGKEKRLPKKRIFFLSAVADQFWPNKNISYALAEYTQSGAHPARHTTPHFEQKYAHCINIFDIQKMPFFIKTFWLTSTNLSLSRKMYHKPTWLLSMGIYFSSNPQLPRSFHFFQTSSPQQHIDQISFPHHKTSHYINPVRIKYSNFKPRLSHSQMYRSAFGADDT